MVDFIASISNNIWVAFAAVMVISGITTALTEVIKNLFKVKGTWNAVVAWVIAILATGVAHLAGVIGHAEPQWLTILLTGIGNGLVSNGIYSIPQIKAWLETWFKKSE